MRSRMQMQLRLQREQRPRSMLERLQHHHQRSPKGSEGCSASPAVDLESRAAAALCHTRRSASTSPQEGTDPISSSSSLDALKRVRAFAKHDLTDDEIGLLMKRVRVVAVYFAHTGNDLPTPVKTSPVFSSTLNACALHFFGLQSASAEQPFAQYGLDVSSSATS